ncbi:MAG: hypothetical protein H6672_20560 [Anaerolineaceae bacterium]|nr:hypothetical protein [Anaerolineaceae bacterium]
MADLMTLGMVFSWAFFSFWSAIPAGITLQIAPGLVALTVTISYTCGVVLVVSAGTPLRARIARRIERSGGTSHPNRALRAIQAAWSRFGLVGLGLVAPVTVGAQLGAVIGLTLGAKPLRLVAAMTFGAALWSAAITLAILAGVLAVSAG